jgi:hypothetical protein
MPSSAVQLSFDLQGEGAGESLARYAAPAAALASAGSQRFASGILAGFERFLGWNDHDLLITTGRVPDGRMRAHYGVAIRHGLFSARDGLPWRHDPRPRLATAAMQMQVIWDLSHFDPPPDPAGHAAGSPRLPIPRCRFGSAR